MFDGQLPAAPTAQGIGEYHGIKIDLARDDGLSAQALKLLKDYYMLPDETSPQQSYARAALAYSYGDLDFAQRIYDYASKGWFMFASPVLSNAPKPGEPFKALPISCFLTYVPDTLKGLIDHQSELAWLSVKGGGVGAHWSDVRAVSKKAPGPIPFMKVSDSAMTAYMQGTTRRGSYAAYMNVSHPDILEFLQIRVPTGGDENRKAFNIHNAINITDDFMKAVQEGADWNLLDPKEGTVRDTMPARELWHRILECRFRTGEPYLNFIDAANRGLPETQKAMGLKIHGSNLCNEIHLATNEERTAVCCLSSVNMEYFDLWSKEHMVVDLIRLLDNVLERFIENCPPEMARAKFSAERERSLGLGVMGWHSYLQSKRIPWESAIAISHLHKAAKLIEKEAKAASKALAESKGEAPDMKGTGYRNAHLQAIAPNSNSSIIAGCSASIEPIKSNAYAHRTRAGTHLVKNDYLHVELIKLGMDTDEVWQSIILNDGSVQHLDIPQELKDVFKTAFELDQRWVVEHAAARQKYIDQGQSVNLFFPAGADKSYVNATHLKAWVSGMKGLYYLRTNTGATADKVSHKIERVALKNFDECIACQG